MIVKFVGESESRTTSDGVVFPFGKPVEVSEVLGESLLEQSVFELVKPQSRPKPNTKES